MTAVGTYTVAEPLQHIFACIGRSNGPRCSCAPKIESWKTGGGVLTICSKTKPHRRCSVGIVEEDRLVVQAQRHQYPVQSPVDDHRRQQQRLEEQQVLQPLPYWGTRTRRGGTQVHKKGKGKLNKLHTIVADGLWPLEARMGWRSSRSITSPLVQYDLNDNYEWATSAL